MLNVWPVTARCRFLIICRTSSTIDHTINMKRVAAVTITNAADIARVVDLSNMLANPITVAHKRRTRLGVMITLCNIATILCRCIRTLTNSHICLVTAKRGQCVYS